MAPQTGSDLPAGGCCGAWLAGLGVAGSALSFALLIADLAHAQAPSHPQTRAPAQVQSPAHVQGLAQAQAQAARSPADGHPVVPFDSRHFTLQRLADGVWAAIQNDDGGWAIANGGIVDLGDRTLVIDPFMTPVAAEDLKRAAETLTGRRVTLVVNTHRHNDHVRGNQVFVPGAEVIGTAAMRREMLALEPADIAREKEFAPRQLAGIEAALKTAPPEAARELRMFESYFRGMLQSHASLVTTPPTLLVETELTLHGTKRTVEIRVLGRGHTASDLVVLLPDERIVFAGDLVFHQRHAYLGDGEPDDWLRLLSLMRGWNPQSVVPGHGPVGTLEALAEMERYIRALQAIAREGLAAGRTVEQIAQTPVPAPFAGWLLRPFYAQNLAFLARRAR